MGHRAASYVERTLGQLQFCHENHQGENKAVNTGKMRHQQRGTKAMEPTGPRSMGQPGGCSARQSELHEVPSLHIQPQGWEGMLPLARGSQALGEHV